MVQCYFLGIDILLSLNLSRVQLLTFLGSDLGIHKTQFSCDETDKNKLLGNLRLVTPSFVVSPKIKKKFSEIDPLLTSMSDPLWYFTWDYRSSVSSLSGLVPLII